MNIAMIPARGGSQRIPQKNIKLFHGKPIIAYSIEAAIQSACFERVIVSTDCEAIAQIASDYGAEVPFMRPAALAGEHASTLAVIAHTLQWLQQEKIPATFLCCLYATAPFVTPELIKEGYELLRASGGHYAFTVTPFAYPIQRALIRDTHGMAKMLNPEHYTKRSQDLQTTYHDAGQYYWGAIEAFAQGKPVYDDKAAMVVVEPHRAQDIDTPSDWCIAEALYAMHTRTQ